MGSGESSEEMSEETEVGVGVREGGRATSWSLFAHLEV
jgi:hypothetical protein